MNLIIKKIIDFVIAILGLILISPLFLLITILIKLTSKGPVFFKQKRVGKNEQIFKILKFRTMIDNNETYHKKTEKNDKRLTKLGKILRRLSLDELPQLINILQGDMSIVGPRPLVYEEVKELTLIEKTRFYFTPGLTSLAVIKGRNSIDKKEKLMYDIKYIKNWSILLDLKIIIKTVLIIISGKGLYSS